MWAWSENQMKIVMIRHGMTKSNHEHRYLGTTDESLSAAGVHQLWRKKHQNCYPKVKYLFVSPMKRCLETANILYPHICPIIIPEWQEMDFGAFEGKNYHDLKNDCRYQAWIDSNGTLPFPEGESREDFILRCDQGFWQMMALLRSKKTETNVIVNNGIADNYPVAMIVHGGTIMSLLSKYHGDEYFSYQVANGNGFICSLKDRNSLRMTNVEKI